MAMTPLGALIEEVQHLFLRDHGVELTYGDVARRSDGRVLRNRVQQLAKDPIKALPSPTTIEGLRRGLGVPYSVVLQRALASAGYDVPDGWRGEGSAAEAGAKQLAELREELHATIEQRTGESTKARGGH